MVALCEETSKNMYLNHVIQELHIYIYVRIYVYIMLIYNS